MSHFEKAILLMLVLSPIVIPIMVYACVKLATGAFYLTRQRFYQQFPERKNQNGDDPRKA